MDCAIAIQYLPMDAKSDEETCRIVDEVIACIDASGLDYYVGPFETTVEGPFEACMRLLHDCQLAGAAAGCASMMTYAKIDFRPEGEVMTTGRKVSKYHPLDADFAPRQKGEVA